MAKILGNTTATPLKVDGELSTTSTNPVQNKVVTKGLDDKVDKREGKGLSSNDFTNEYKSMLDNRMIEYVGGGIGANKNLITAKAAFGLVADKTQELEETIYGVMDDEVAALDNRKVEKVEGKGLSTYDFNDTYQKMLAGVVYKGEQIESKSIAIASARAVYEFVGDAKQELRMQKIFETTVTEENTSPIQISEDMNGNPFKLDEVFIQINLPTVLTEAKPWWFYANGKNVEDNYLFYMSTNTTGKRYVFKAERMCENVWFTLRNTNLTASVNNNLYYSSYAMSGVDYIKSLGFYCSGIPVGSTVVVCGRKVVE